MERITYKGLEIGQSHGHGAAVKGTKQTATIQVIKRDGSTILMVHQVKFKVGCPPCRDEAIVKAKAWVDKLITTQEEFERCRDDQAYFVENYVKKQTTAGQMEEVGDRVTDLLRQMYNRLPYWMRMTVKPTKSLDT